MFRYNGIALEADERKEIRGFQLLLTITVCAAALLIAFDTILMIFSRRATFISLDHRIAGIYIFLIMITPLYFFLCMRYMPYTALFWMPLVILVFTFLFVAAKPHKSLIIRMDHTANEQRRMQAVQMYDRSELEPSESGDGMFMLPGELSDLSLGGIVRVDHLDNVYFICSSNGMGLMECLVYSRDGKAPIKHPGYRETQEEMGSGWYWYERKTPNALTRSV